MSNEQDMDAPVTRRELREELAALESRLEQKLEQKLGAFRIELSAEFARHANAILEQCREWFVVIDDKYKALPGRVQKLDDTVQSLTDRVQRLEDAAPKPKRPRRAAR